MNATPPPNTETALKKELAKFRELCDYLINASLNRLFDLRPEYAQFRTRILLILFLTIGLFLTLIHYPLKLWYGYGVNILLGISITNTDPISDFINLVIQSVIDPRILQYLPIFVAPFYIAQQLAAFYLADIFELENVNVARKFINEVALTASDETIRISQGKISNEYRESPNFLIGGPGKVIVDLDSAALFERADGTPHVIGPTGKEPGGKATIGGFERFRFAFDIRDHHVELRDQSPSSSSVKSRSIDGIPITATDVRLMFSINRGTNQPSAEFPYPINPEALERLVYKASSRVTPENKEPSDHKLNWINSMIGLVRGRLGGFMSERKLTEYLASIGAPELEKNIKNEKTINEDLQKLTEPNPNPNIKEPKAPPFTPRNEITKLFSDNFKKSAEESGVELHWIGVGTWQAPLEIDVISENHLKAWEISQDNLKNSTDTAMTRVESEATLHKMESLIQAVPIGSYNEILNPKHYGYNKKSGGSKKQSRAQTWNFNDSADLDLNLFSDEELDDLQDAFKQGAKKNINRVINKKLAAMEDTGHPETDAEHNENLRSFLGEYRTLLLEAVEILKSKNESSPSITQAISHINTQMGWPHWVGTSMPRTDPKK